MAFFFPLSSNSLVELSNELALRICLTHIFFLRSVPASLAILSPTPSMHSYLVLILVYSAAQLALGAWISRRVRNSRDFFVAGRSLGPGLIFSTMLAANIGANRQSSRSFLSM